MRLVDTEMGLCVTESTFCIPLRDAVSCLVLGLRNDWGGPTTFFVGLTG